MITQPFPFSKNDKPKQCISLRDYFAAKAMQAIINRYGLEENDEILARKSYEVADVMLKQRDL